MDSWYQVPLLAPTMLTDAVHIFLHTEILARQSISYIYLQPSVLQSQLTRRKGVESFALL